MSARFLILLAAAAWVPAAAASGAGKTAPWNYTVAFKGVDDPELAAALEAASETAGRTGHPPLTLGMLKRRVENDAETLQKVLRAQGYFAAGIGSEIDPTRRPLRVVFRIRTGKRFRLGEIAVEAAGAELQLPSPRELGLIPGDPARSAAVIEGRRRLLESAARSGFPLAEIAGEEVTVDHATGLMNVSFRLDPGPEARFGTASVAGIDSVEERFVLEKISWREGDRFDPRALEELRKELVETGLFSLVRVGYPRRLDAEGRLPVTIEVQERKHRTIKIGAGYRTDIGPEAKFSWEDRNIFGSGERLGLDAAVSPIEYAAASWLRIPDFLRRRQTLNLGAEVGRDEPDAYTSDRVEVSAIVERVIGPTFLVGGGAGAKAARVRQLGTTDRYLLIMMPLYAEWDTTNDLLDADRGWRLRFQISPNLDPVDTGTRFLQGLVSCNRYLRIFSAPDLTAAARAAVGATLGPGVFSIPADERFYAGGGGSVRGYAYQSAGPLSADDTPEGGKSLAEVNLELRWRIVPAFGAVAFLDGGTAFTRSYPDFGEQSLLWGAGLGVRYFSPVGPFRLDGAVPLNRRKGVDDAFQIYISLGQAF
ncbi:MAG TPA: BamA/TamA family outer membrane protein [bacterium]|nr:BamA/TamA family outer membrane protein [bacterium]HPQ66698.1 BamA/TamA family outer membrane protein [bacterium]